MADLLPSMASDEELDPNDSGDESDENVVDEMDESFQFGGILVRFLRAHDVSHRCGLLVIFVNLNFNYFFNE